MQDVGQTRPRVVLAIRETVARCRTTGNTQGWYAYTIDANDAQNEYEDADGWPGGRSLVRWCPAVVVERRSSTQEDAVQVRIAG